MIITRRQLDTDALYKRFTASTTCPHTIKEVRKRKIKGDSIIYQMQCPACGEKFGGALGRDRFSASEIAAMKDWDGALAESFRAKSNERYNRMKAEEETKILEEWQAAHAQYISSPAWRKKRDAVILRAQGICEGCRKHQATEVHHLTYEHLGEEFLFELVALCRSCHERIHLVPESIAPEISPARQSSPSPEDDAEDCPF